MISNDERERSRKTEKILEDNLGLNEILIFECMREHGDSSSHKALRVNTMVNLAAKPLY